MPAIISVSTVGNQKLCDPNYHFHECREEGVGVPHSLRTREVLYEALARTWGKESTLLPVSVTALSLLLLCAADRLLVFNVVVS